MCSARRVGAAEERFRGRHGALPITDPDWRSPLCEAFIHGALEPGVARNDDYNDTQQDGTGYFQRYDPAHAG
jgi:choline dehydrogenase